MWFASYIDLCDLITEDKLSGDITFKKIVKKKKKKEMFY